MKKLFLVFIIVTIVFAVFPVAIHADEVTIEETTPFVDVSEMETTTPITDVTEPITESEGKPVEDITDTPTETPKEAHTSPVDADAASLLARIQEALEKGEISTVINLAFDIVMIIVLAILKKSGGKNKVEMVTALKNSKDTTVGAVNDLIVAANDVINAVEGEGGIKTIIEDFKQSTQAQIDEIKAQDKEKLEGYGVELANTMASVKLLAEMLQTVYANSTTIPQSTKNMIGDKYLEICHKLNGGNNE